MSPKPLASHFQWSYDEGEASGYASSVTVSSEQIGTVSANMVDNNHDNDLIGVWRLKSKLQKLNKRLWIIISKCWHNPKQSKQR